MAREGSESTVVSRRTLEEHYLRAMECDEVNHRDKPHCCCSLIDLGWHNTVMEAVRAWLDHVQSVQREKLGVLAHAPERCVFCSQPQHQAFLLVKGPPEFGGHCICSACIEDAQGCVNEHYERLYRDHGALEYDSWLTEEEESSSCAC